MHIFLFACLHGLHKGVFCICCIRSNTVVEKCAAPEKGRCEILGDGQEMHGCDSRLMAKVFMMIIQVNLCFPLQVGFHN